MSNLIYQPKSQTNQHQHHQQQYHSSHSHHSNTAQSHGGHNLNSNSQSMQNSFPFPSSHSNDFIPGTASLVEEVDKRLLVVLRDGRKLVGTLRSFDQFANVVLEDTFERIYLDDNVTFGEKKVGLFVVRGENVVLLGEMDVDKDANVNNTKLKQIPYEQAKKLYNQEQQNKEDQAKLKRKALAERGVLLDPFSYTTDNLYFE